jgi:hypothetical protein
MEINLYPEDLWERLLSRRPEVIRQAFLALSPDDQQNILEHLQRMAQEEGWQSEQRFSALAALEALRNVAR